ncbi:MAG: SDR family oxidoreductase, partial [Spirochaetia bacterium]|nr:SDR family oxidoreductase [Spirochaetia bacterium]
MGAEGMDTQIVIVTGGSRGIGFGIASCFAKKGASLVIADVNEPSAQKSAADLQALGAGKSIGVACDITNRADVEKLMDQVVAEFGRIDVLVNNAGICPFVDIMELKPETWDKTIDVNLTGAFHCTQLAARKMIERGKGGRIIFITSLSEHVTGPSQVDYAASKSGLRMTMAGFATALGKH